MAASTSVDTRPGRRERGNFTGSAVGATLLVIVPTDATSFEIVAQPLNAGQPFDAGIVERCVAGLDGAAFARRGTWWGRTASRRTPSRRALRLHFASSRRVRPFSRCW